MCLPHTAGALLARPQARLCGRFCQSAAGGVGGRCRRSRAELARCGVGSQQWSHWHYPSQPLRVCCLNWGYEGLRAQQGAAASPAVTSAPTSLGCGGGGV
eukprot:1159706-Pelagomonas_calceolata.AAC.1